MYVWNRDRNNYPAIQNARCRYVDSERHPGIPSAGAEHRVTTSKLRVERSAGSCTFFSGLRVREKEYVNEEDRTGVESACQSLGSIKGKGLGSRPERTIELGNHNVPLPPKNNSSNRTCCWFHRSADFHRGSALRPASSIIGLTLTQP